jgi:hypothetical protein
MANRVALCVLVAVQVMAIMGCSVAVGASANSLELRCIHQSGVGRSFEQEVDRVTINPAEQKIRFWASKRDDGWQFGNGGSEDIFPYKETTSLRLHPDGVIDGTGHNFFVSAAFRYSQEDGRLQWVWIGGAGGVYQMEFNCRRIN